MEVICRKCPNHCLDPVGLSDAELRAEVNRRGFEMHHKGFSLSMQNEIRACQKLQSDAKALEERITNTLKQGAR